MLTSDRDRLSAWRLVESYCATDPCDPDTLRPDNIGNTAEQYRNIPVDQVYLTRSNSQEALFFEMAMPGVARFEPEAGAAAIRRLADHMLTRQDWPATKHYLLSCLPAF